MNTIGKGFAATILVAISLAAALPAGAETSRVVVTGDAGIRVWLEQEGDVLTSYEDVVVSFHPLRDCYATVYVVDTSGGLHVVYPFESGDRAWVQAGVTYRYSAQELGLDGFAAEGIAHLFAVGSQRPQQLTRTRVVSTSRTVKESRREYQEKYRQKTERTVAELASARAVGAEDKELAKQQRVTKRTESTPKGKPTSSSAAKAKSDSERNEEGKARSASNKAR